MTQAVKYGFHFSYGRRMGYGDNRIIKEGKSYSVDGQIVVCHNGLHASPTPYDAFQNVMGNILSFVKTEGDICKQNSSFLNSWNKWAARKRTHLAVIRLSKEEESVLHWLFVRGKKKQFNEYVYLLFEVKNKSLRKW